MRDRRLPQSRAARAVPILVAILLAVAELPAQEAGVSSAQFAAKAYASVPVEEPYAFRKVLSEWREPFRRDPSASPGAEEMALPASGWKVLIRSDAGMVLQQAALDFSDYLERSMEIRVAIEKRESLADWASLKKAIVAGTREQLPGCGGELQARKDYQIIVTPDRIAVCGFDESGAMYGLYNLEARMNLRQAPFLPKNLNTTRRSLFGARVTLSGLGWTEWPDAYLTLLARYGFDAILDYYSNPDGTQAAPYVEGGWFKTREPAQVHDLGRRAARHGISLYSQLMYHYTDEPANEADLRAFVRSLVGEFPEIRGYILATEGFWYKSWFGGGGGGGPEALKEWVRHWARGVGIVADECRKLNPAIEVLPWDYNINFRPDQVEVKKYVVSQYPQYAIPIFTFENGKGFELDGEHSWLQDYSISQVGPAEVTEAQIAVAKQRGQRAVYAKADAWATWQFGTFPYLPFPYQWYARYQALEKYGINGTIESHSYGFKPNWVAEMRTWYSWSDAPPLDKLLRAIARREFGPGSEELVLKAWDHFSRAIRLMPDTGPTWGTNNAVAAPLFFERPQTPRTMTFEHSWTDQARWSRVSRVNPYWPYTPSEFFLYPDFSNQVNVAERYARPLSLPVFNKYLGLAAEEMEKGLRSYRRAALNAPASKRLGAFREVLLAEQLERMMRSERAVLEFEDLRFRLVHCADRAERGRILDRMAAILAEEIARTTDSLETARRDSRLGYEWEQDYIYSPNTLEEKLKELRVALEQQIPRYRKSVLRRSPSLKSNLPAQSSDGHKESLTSRGF